MSGKGDTPRPLSVSADEYARRWERAFGRPSEPVEVHPVWQPVRKALLDWYGVAGAER